MKASILKTIWIGIKGIINTFRITGGATIQARCKNLSREDADDYIKRWATNMLNDVSLSYTVHNPNNVTFEKNKRYLLMSNHGSLYDMPLIFLSFPISIRMIGKKGLFQVPIMGHAIRAAEFISIDRKNLKQAIKDLASARKKMEDGVTYWMSPEGTRSRDGKLGKFKKGPFITAIKAEAIIIPFGIRGARDVCPPADFNLYTDQSAEIYIGQPVDASKYTMEQRDQLKDEIEVQIKALADL